MQKSNKKDPPKLLNARKSKENDYVVKRNNYLMILRILIWGILLFFFVRGVAISLQPTDEQQITRTITNFKQEFATFKGENEEIMAFAQNFAREYLTYTAKGDKDYKNRLQPYISRTINNLPNINNFSDSAAATYVQAYRKEQYGPNQYDVYVLADVSYKSAASDEYGSTVVTTTTMPTHLKIPIYAGNGAYIVEDLPIFVSDSMLLGDYQTSSAIAGTRASEAEVADIKTALLNFFSAYYEADQSVIDYYLSPAADKSTFWGLNGRYRFDRIENLTCYSPNSGEYLCLVGLYIRDSMNDAVLYQEYNLSIRSEGTRYYIQDMNTKTINLNY